MTARSILAFGLNDSWLILRDSFLRMKAAMIVLMRSGCALACRHSPVP